MDIETGLSVLPKQKKTLKNRTILFLRTFIHTFYIVIHMIVTGEGLQVVLSITEEQMKEPLFSNLRWFAFAYGTNWNYVFQTVFLFLAVGHDVLQWADKQHTSLGVRVRYWRDVIYNGLVVPYTCFVFTMFWSLYTIDRELVFPRVYDAVVPWWFNQCVHTNILVLVVIETFLQARTEPTDKRLELIFDGSVGILYAIVYYSIYFFAHRWLYNVFGIMTWWQVCIFQLGIWASSYIFYVIHFPINRLIHGRKEDNSEITKGNGEVTLQNGEITPKNGDVGTIEHVTHKNGASVTKNGEVLNTNGELTQKSVDAIDNNDVKKANEEHKNIFTITHSNTDLNIPPFSTRSWSLKYRNLRSQFENSSL